MALLIGGLAPFIVVHLVPTRPSLRVGLVLIVLGYATSRGCGAAIRSCGSRRRAQRERSRKKAGNWGPMSILGFQQFAHGSALSGGGRARYL